MTTFKVGDVVRAKTAEDLRYLNACSNFTIDFDTNLVVKKVGLECLYFDGIDVGAFPHRFVKAFPPDKSLEDYL